ncbi:MAG TPA: LeuA family protein [Pseudomonadota bacterium]|jgi:2-isopropylmalate synthase|nr:2-isopropylmalate synthase [Deltaproteobacteria bacterium]HPH27019.1 LeuA family protein [Pseudomonadota bacterium]
MKSTAQPASDIIYDWNTRDAAVPLVPPGFSLFDETLRDGIQSPSVHDPSIEDKLQIVHLLDQLGIEYLDLSLPGAGPRALEDGVRLVKEIADCKLRIRPACAARTHLNDIRPIAEIAQRTGVAVEVMTFIGSSPIRLYAEDWDEARMLKLSAEAIDFSVQNGLPCTYVTEDTTRARPEMLASLFKNALDHGSQRLCICDTVGHATPAGVSSLLGFTRSVIDGMGLSGKIGIDWHGHNDRGLGVINALWALRCGADRVHGTVLGIGERVGNAAIDQILVNLYLMGALPEGRDLSKLVELAQLVSRACNVPIPYNYPVLGEDAFRTATGVHAAAIIKAERKGDAFLADRIYSSVPAALFGRQQEIEIGPMSGESNVMYWLRKNGLPPEPALVKQIMGLAKSTNRLLGKAEILDLARTV